MSQNGPYPGSPFPGRDADGQPYAEPADPWGDQGAAVPDPSWSVPQQPLRHQPVAVPQSGSLSGAPMWGPPVPVPAPPKRNTPIVALVITLGVLIVVGLGTTAWLLNGQAAKRDKPASAAQASASVAADPGAGTQSSEDARFVKAGQCVVNQGTEGKPVMHKSVCASGAYEVLKRIDGPTTGEADAKSKCSRVPGYTKWYFFDSSLDELDFVLCLKERKGF
jgi:hypothetical protein